MNKRTRKESNANLPKQRDCEYINAFLSDGTPICISKADLASVVAGAMGTNGFYCLKSYLQTIKIKTTNNYTTYLVFGSRIGQPTLSLVYRGAVGTTDVTVFNFGSNQVTATGEAGGIININVGANAETSIIACTKFDIINL